MFRMCRPPVMAALVLGLAWLGLGGAAAAAPALAPREGDFVIRDFRFASGEILPELRLHYTTLGAPRRDAGGHVVNAVLILHGTGGSGAQFLRPQFADVLFAPGGELDPAKYFIILPDGIGHGKSSRPSDGLHARFPHYAYADMVEAQHRLTTDGLKVDHLRLVMGTSMGCMHSFLWAETWPNSMDAVMPLACLPVQIAGRNRMWRKMAMEAIISDPAWRGGDYVAQPRQGLRTAVDLLILAGAAPLPYQIAYPTRDAADAWLMERTAKDLAADDANDLLYQLDSSRDYDPSAGLERIMAPLVWINSADDFINPPELGIAEREARRLRTGRFLLIPAGEATHGHGTHTWAALWREHLADLLARSEPGAEVR